MLIIDRSKGQSLRWTAYFDDCLRVLQDTKEFESDEILVQILKFRLVSEKVIDSSFAGVAGQGLSETIPATFYVKSLKSELDKAASTIPSRLVNDGKSAFSPMIYPHDENSMRSST